MHELVVAIFGTPGQADAALQDLRAASIPEDAVSVHAGTGASRTGAVADPQMAPMRETHFRSGLFGAPDHEAVIYDRSIAGGATVLSVRTSEDQAEGVIDILERHNPIDVEDRATDGDTPAPTAVAEQRIELAEEELVVGKRAVSRGTVRVRRFTVETPVERLVTLRDETIAVERTDVTDGRAPGADIFTDKVVEMTGTVEEPVVEKTARVVAEVSLRKQVSERVETVRDTVRRAEVEITPTPRE